MEYEEKKKKRKSAICENMDEPWGHYKVKWDRDKKKYWMLSLTCKSKKDELTETESSLVVGGGRVDEWKQSDGTNF